MTADPERERHTCALCDKTAMVGVENPARWLCLPHFEEWLAERRTTLQLLREGL